MIDSEIRYAVVFIIVICSEFFAKTIETNGEGKVKYLDYLL